MIFCDWLSLHQTHFGMELPRINNGAVFCVDTNGEIEWTTEANFIHQGSYDTKIQIKCDGNRVALRGNVGRFKRPDNLFGYSVEQCIQIANGIVRTFGLPEFSKQRFNLNAGGSALGASITRIDLTCNYVTGSRTQAIKLLHFLAGQDIGRRGDVKAYGHNGVTWGEGSKYTSSKAYLKEESLGEHVSETVKEWTKAQGIVRFEGTLKSRFLAQKKLQDIDAWKGEKGIEMENILFGKFTEALTRGTATTTHYDEIGGRVGALANAYRAGLDLWNDETVSERTRRRWRRELLGFGIDIKQPSNIVRLHTKINTINIQAVEAPAWYWHESKAA